MPDENRYLQSPTRLMEEGLLAPADCEECFFPSDHVELERIIRSRNACSIVPGRISGAGHVRTCVQHSISFARKRLVCRRSPRCSWLCEPNTEERPFRSGRPAWLCVNRLLSPRRGESWPTQCSSCALANSSCCGTGNSSRLTRIGAECGCSAIFPSLFPRIRRTYGPIPSCSFWTTKRSPGSSSAFLRIISAHRASSEETQYMSGRRSDRRAIVGGFNGSRRGWIISTRFAAITFVASRRPGTCLLERRRRLQGGGCRVQARISSTKCSSLWMGSRCSPKTWESSHRRLRRYGINFNCPGCACFSSPLMVTRTILICRTTAFTTAWFTPARTTTIGRAAGTTRCRNRSRS